MMHVEKKNISLSLNKGKRDKGNTAGLRKLDAIGQITEKGGVVILDSDWTTRRSSRFLPSKPELLGSADCPLVLRWNISSFSRIKYNDSFRPNIPTCRRCCSVGQRWPRVES